MLVVQRKWKKFAPMGRLDETWNIAAIGGDKDLHRPSLQEKGGGRRNDLKSRLGALPIYRTQDCEKLLAHRCIWLKGNVPKSSRQSLNGLL